MPYLRGSSLSSDSENEVAEDSSLMMSGKEEIVVSGLGLDQTLPVADMSSGLEDNGMVMSLIEPCVRKIGGGGAVSVSAFQVGCTCLLEPNAMDFKSTLCIYDIYLKREMQPLSLSGSIINLLPSLWMSTARSCSSSHFAVETWLSSSCCRLM